MHTTTSPEEKVEEILTKVASSKKKKVALSLQSKEDFFKSFMSEQPYTETLSAYEGKIQVKFKGLLISEQEEILSQITKDEVAGENTSTAQYFNKLQFMRLTASLVTINNVVVFEKEKTLLERLTTLKVMPSAKVFILNKLFVMFEEKVEALAEAMQDETFYEAAG